MPSACNQISSLYVSKYHSVPRVDTRQVDLVDELDRGWLVGVFGTAMHGEAVDSVLVNALEEKWVSILLGAGETGTYVGGT